jgi:diaminopimelate decarboxylase
VSLNSSLRTSTSETFDGVNIVDFCRSRETPFYLISERRIISACDRFASLMNISRTEMFYSLKTNYELPVLRTINSQDVGVEVYRKAELAIALSAGFKGKNIIMDGPCKSRDDLEAALSSNVSLINAESWDEIALLNEMAGARGMIQPIGIRVNPGIRQSLNLFNYAAIRHSKPFGFDQDELGDLFVNITNMKNVKLSCILVHMSIPVVSPKIFIRRIELLFRAADQARRTGHPVDRIDLGGGYPSDEVIRLNLPSIIGNNPFLSFFQKVNREGIVGELGKAISKTYKEYAKKYSFEPKLVMEPGRYLVDDAMIVVGRIVEVKGKTVLTDISGVTEVGYQPHFSPRKVTIANGESSPPYRTYKICGPTMLPFDVIATNVRCQKISRGDIIVVHNVGAYCTSSSKPFMLPRCACYFVDRSSTVHLSRRKETYRDMIDTQEDLTSDIRTPFKLYDRR